MTDHPAVRAALAAVVSAAICTASALAATTTPILGGPWAPNQRGYGQVRPRTVDNNGDPTGRVTDIHWTTWGGTKAIGTGMSDYVGPNQSVAGGTEESARIVAFHLGSCHRRRAYDAIEWYYPQHGQRFSAGGYLDPCNGRYYRGGKPLP
jgi:opacity protein-like surface antigen